MLDCFHAASKEKEQKQFFDKFFEFQPNRLEVEYFIRMLNKNLRIKAGAAQLLKALSVEAKSAYDHQNDLAAVIRLFHGAATQKATKSAPSRATKTSSTPPVLSTNVFCPVKPMLAKPCKTYAQCVKACPAGFFAEVKYDGERIQIHKNGDVFRYFSRSLKDVKPDKVTGLDVFLHQACGPDISTVILDAEILLVDTRTHKPLPFGTLNKYKRRQIANAQVCVFVFDILRCNGEDLCGTPLLERRKKLQSVLHTVPDRVACRNAST